MKVRYQGREVDVVAKVCPQLPCFTCEPDKGPFVQGRGYVRIPERLTYVCGTRHLHGCPMVARCTKCNRVMGPSAQGCCSGCYSSEHVVPYPESRP